MTGFRKLGWIALCALGVQAPLEAQTSPPIAEASLRRLADNIKPTAEEVRWQQLPWELDAHEAIRLAKKEQRPIFFWAAGGRDRDGVALERC